MIPVTLSIQGIYSYQNKQTIDFTKLTAAGIFGIFGQVGSGKSTILEAITFALYGRTDRLNLSGDNRNYNMMNLKSNEMIIEFIFRTGAEQTEYMAVVRSRRNSKQFDDVKACDRSAYKKEDGAWIPVEVESLETVIGLSYDNFKRTIIIPQGKFQEFLMLGSKERTQMMKELFNLERYELYYKVASLESKANQQKQNIEGNLQQLGDITKEQILAAENTLIETIKEIELKTTELSILQAEENNQRRIKELSENAAKHQKQLLTLKQQEPDIAKLEKGLTSYEYCLVHFKSLLNSFENANSNIENVKRVITGDEASLKDISYQLGKNETEFESLSKAYENRELFKQKAEELIKIERIFDLQDRYRNFLDRIAKGEKLIADTVLKIESLKIQQQENFTVLKELKGQNPDINRLSRAKEWFIGHKAILTAAKELETEKNIINTEIEDLLQRKALLFSDDCFIGISITEGYDNTIKYLDAKKLTHRNAIELLNNEKQHYQVQQKLLEYATGLEDGLPCPLCGSLSHPAKFNTLNIQESLVKISNEVLHHEKAVTFLETCLKKLTEINTILCFKEESLGKVLQKQKENQRSNSVHQELFIWDEFRDEQILTQMLDKAEKIQTEIGKTENLLEEVRIKIEKEGNQKELYTKTLADIRNNALQELATANTLKEQLTILNINDFSEMEPEFLTRQRNELLDRHKLIEQQYQQAVIQVNKLRKEQDMLSGKLEVNRKTLETELANYNQLTLKIEEQLKASVYNSIDEIKAVLNWNPDLEKERRKIAVFRQDIDFVEKQIAIIENELGDRKFDNEKYSLLIKTIEQLQSQINFKNQEKGRLEVTITSLKADFETRQKLQEQLSKLELRLEDLKTLKQLFKGGGFVKYISSVYLQELIHSANDRFYKLTGQKLRLEITSENDFEVRDFMNGGKLRHVKTLSGGQIFQASLSLALALSDNTKKLSGAEENFFFLDEGFGSLDKESLEVVFETLKSLRHENRIVGIISHVEEMNQEIDIHLKVKNNEETGSSIEKSWEIL